MNTLHRSVFHDKEWGTSTVQKDTLANLTHQQVKLLETKNDIDLYEDIEGIPEIMNRFIHTKK